MKRWQLILTSLFGLLIWCLVLASPVWSLGRGEGFRPYLYAPGQTKGPSKPFNGTGKVGQVLSEKLTSGNYSMAIVLDSETEGLVYVYLGPVWYLERHGLEPFPGDEVQVKGIFETEPDWRFRVTAYEIRKDDHFLQLRDSEGRPIW